MTAACTYTMEPHYSRPGKPDFRVIGASETVSQPLASVHQIRVRPVAKRGLKYQLEQLSMRPWFGEVSIQLKRFLSYAPDWNGYREKAISERAVIGAIFVLIRIGLDGPKPVVVPVYDGGIQIEWYYDQVEIEVEISPNGPKSIFFMRADGSFTDEVIHDWGNPIWDELHEAITDLRAVGVG